MEALERAQELRTQGAEARRQGDLDRALALHLEAMTAFEEAGDPAWIARGCISVAADHALMESPYAALEWDMRSLEVADASGDPLLRIMARNNTALDLCELARPDEALPYFREALRLSVERGDQPQIFRGHHSLGYGLAQLGRWDDAVSEFETSADQQRGGGEEPGELAVTLMELAGCYVELGRRDDAIAVLEEACADFTSAGDTASAEGCRARIAELRAL